MTITAIGNKITKNKKKGMKKDEGRFKTNSRRIKLEGNT